MAFNDHFDVHDDLHPIDIVEALATRHDWDFDRLAEDQIAMVITGQWRSYRLTLAWSPCDQVLRLICTYDMNPPAERLPMIHELLNLTNEQVWDGCFTFWTAQGQMVWRYGLVLAGEALASDDQIDRMIGNALKACERFYPSFQLVAWGETAPLAALDIALGEVYGRA